MLDYSTQLYNLPSSDRETCVGIRPLPVIYPSFRDIVYLELLAKWETLDRDFYPRKVLPTSICHVCQLQYVPE